MPDIALLEPRVLRGLIEELDPLDGLMMVNKLRKTSWPFPSVTWDVIKGSRQIARPNIPNSEAHIVPKLTSSQKSAAFCYLREKKVFEPTTLHWLRTPGEMARTNAEKAVLREVNDLNQRFDYMAEWMCWQALTGHLVFDFEDVRTEVDYDIPASHKPVVTDSWANDATTHGMIRDQFAAWKRLIARDGHVRAEDAYLTEPTLFKLFTKFAEQPEIMSDRMKDEYFKTGTLPGFMGMNWNTVEHTYTTSDGAVVQFLPDDAIIMGSFKNNAMEIYQGPTADDEAPANFTGKYSKTWKEKDPSARQILLEWHLLPVITRPEQFIYIADVAP